MNSFETVIGLEVHVQLNTESKIFCPCPTDFGSSPNTNICPVCCGYPGVLPVFNRKVLELAVRACLALNCGKVNNRIYFERKNYFYPDLPKNYQISQYKLPLGQEGYIQYPPRAEKTIGIERIHLEEDAGKLIHKSDYSLVDFNRTGIPLLEIVSKPEIKSPGEAFWYLKLLKLTLQYIGVSSCDMEKGYLRCDANISVREKGQSILGTKVELKNMNSFRGVRDALEYEQSRQMSCLRDNKRIVQETRLWDEAKRKTLVMRSKEEAHDYRYFPEPDLLDFTIDESLKDKQSKSIGELPIDKYQKFSNYLRPEGGLGEKEIDTLVADKWLSEFFEAAVRESGGDFKNVANWLLGPFLEQVNSLGEGFTAVKISAKNFSKIVKYFLEGRINNLAAKKILSLSVATNEDIDALIEREGLAQVSQTAELAAVIHSVVHDNPKPVKEYLAGKQQAIMFLVGQVMKKTQGRANPNVAREMLEKAINEKKDKGKSEKEEGG